MSSVSESAAALLLCCASTLAHADTVWQCWYDSAQHVACVLSEAAPAAAVDAEQQPASTQAPAIGRPGRLPPLANAVRNNPGALRGRVIRIPLHTEPSDHVAVAELTKDVMCGRKIGCRAIYSKSLAWDLASAIAFVDANDPLLDAGE